MTPADIATLKELVRSWEPPRVDVLVIATTGRLTADAVCAVERHNQSDQAMRIEVWNDAHLENILAAKPHLIADFGLR
ncbi:MAG: hypothetical protein ACXW3D_00060 [Caulobacteraceae bacterium]